MPYGPDHKLETRRKIIESARRLFNRKGFAEVSIDEVMENAGLTRGGFYRHFRDKEELYAEAVRHFLRKEVPERWQKGLADVMPRKVFARFVVDAYLSRDHLEDVEGSCPLIALSSDAARSGGGVKAAYREVAQSMIEVFKANLQGRTARDQAVVLVALCVGGMALARALDESEPLTSLRSRRLVGGTAAFDSLPGRQIDRAYAICEEPTARLASYPADENRQTMTRFRRVMLPVNT